MPVLTVALLQMVASGTDQDANLRKGDAFCRRARAMGADIALFPEMWNIGYTPFPGCAVNYHQVGAETPEQARARAAWQAQAIGPDDAFVVHFRELARELDMAIALTYLERWPGAPRNTVSLIDRHGEIVLTYAKVHTCDFGLEAALTPGDDFPVCTLDTAAGPVRVGAMICFDREFPESARLLMLNGAEIILTPNACPLEPNRIGQFRARAFENMVGVAMANYAAPQQNGHSVAFDPIAFDEEERSRDTLIVEAGEAEGIYLAPFDLDRLRAWRQREVWGNAFRRPHRYGPLVAPEVQDPFVRRDARGVPYDPTAR
ncbi:carbon-nitrogen hydrolase family protein [Sphaerobacter thermophilus]|jgi:predicted amidohydrolase|uniref:carbon-nitrogen hydrolase family protein n=1 Tax=Sphaerobacter thermophilus TaxID=2057 RepID=UPI000DB16883|nr:MAG: carbon-nitrogen hydrolase family protein [Sphaerobacter thermophilus]